MLACTRVSLRTSLRGALRVVPTRNQHCIALYADRAVLVLNKPPGIDSQLNKTDSAMRNLIVDLQQESMIEHPFPVHRLDKNTTGVLICGKTRSAIMDLSSQFKSRTVEKVYLAIVRGGKETFDNTSGQVENYLRNDRGYMRVVQERIPGDKLATTSWEPIAPLSLLRLIPKTGFKHQLRVQLANMGAPILGDTRYSMNPIHTSISNIMDIPEDTLFLHAAYGSFYRFRKERKPRRFRLGVMAPIPTYFSEVCRIFDMPLHNDYTQGGVYIDGERVDSGILEDLGGRWLLQDPRHKDLKGDDSIAA